MLGVYVKPAIASRLPTASCLDVCQLPSLSPSPHKAEASGCFQGAGNPGIAGCELSADDSRVISPEIRLCQTDMKALRPSHGAQRVLDRARDPREAGDGISDPFPLGHGPLDDPSEYADPAQRCPP